LLAPKVTCCEFSGKKLAIIALEIAAPRPNDERNFAGKIYRTASLTILSRSMNTTAGRVGGDLEARSFLAALHECTVAILARLFDERSTWKLGI
jgi:hypothetical protein